MKYYLVMVFSIFIILTGCSTESQEDITEQINAGEEEASYAAILRVNEAEYYSIGNENQGKYTLEEEIGEIKKRVPAEVLPRENLVSNYLDEGTLIFSVKENSNILLAEKKDKGGWEIFEKSNIE